MEEKRYIISDASKFVDVESHVLRYWEEELEIDIPRNEMGHRYYTEFHITLLKKIKELKEQGYGLKAIKMLMPQLMAGQEITMPVEEATLVTAGAAEPLSKMEQFQIILTDIVKQALQENNEALSKSVSLQVSDHVIKEMDYQMRMKEEQEEARYRKLDEAIRSRQKQNRTGKKDKDKYIFFKRKQRDAVKST
jgi:DNA-binding transcriptional MerR regulator